MDTTFITLLRRYREIISKVNSHPYDHQYEFMDEATFEQLIRDGKIETANAVYIREILFRAHMAAVTTLFRNEKWLLGTEAAIAQLNYYSFAASLRGFVESAADSVYCLRHVPATLCQHYQPYRLALGGRFGGAMMTCPELEDALIHYSHGKKHLKGAAVPKAHVAKSAQEYLVQLEEQGSTKVRELYADLCQVAHPAEQTVSMFVVPKKDSPNVFVIDQTLDMALIATLLDKHASAFPNVFQMSFNAALVSLFALNQFGDQRLFTKGLAKLDLSSIPAFLHVSKAMR